MNIVYVNNKLNQKEKEYRAVNEWYDDVEDRDSFPNSKRLRDAIGGVVKELGNEYDEMKGKVDKALEGLEL